MSADVDHGYSAYSNGCRCSVCREAKAAYMREARHRRAKTRDLVRQRGTGRNYVDGITHGYSGYQNHQCRCDVCEAAKSEHHQLIDTPRQKIRRRLARQLRTPAAPPVVGR